MLLKDGKPFELSKEEILEYSREIVFLQPTDPKWNPANGDYDIKGGTGITTSYITTTTGGANGKQMMIRYYENSYYDDTSKREVYQPNNIMIQHPLMFIKTRKDQYELNWFLLNHPGNMNHPAREAARAEGTRDPLFHVVGQFRVHDKNKKAQMHLLRLKYHKALMDHILEGGSKSWKHKELVSACETLIAAQDPLKRLPNDIYNYSAYGEEESDILRAALATFCDNNENISFAHATLITDRNVNVASKINNALSNPEKSCFDFDAPKRQFKIKKDGKWEVYATIPGTVRLEPVAWLTDQANKDKGIMGVIMDASLRVPMEQ